MKKIIFYLIVFISNFSVAQAVLEHSYIEGAQRQPNNGLPMFITDNGTNYYEFNSVTRILLIYNSSHNLIKTINIPLTAGATRINSVSLFSDKLFNSDSLIEFVVMSYGTGQSYLTLFNENATIVQQLGNDEGAELIKISNTNFKLLTWKELNYPFPNDNRTYYPYKIYSLPGTTLNLTQNQNIENLQFFGFTNPTENNIELTNNLNIGQNAVLEVFDINGKKVIQKDVIGTSENINLDISELNNGIYFAKLNNQTTKFIKK